MATTAQALAQAGRAELARGRWQAARDLFAEALAAGEEPGALEGLAWAAWWLDDGPAAMRAREGAYRLNRQRGDAEGAARAAVWLAADHLDFHGAASVAAGWLRRARRLLEGRPPGPEHGWLDFHEGYLAHLGGDPEGAARLAAGAARAGRRAGVPDLEMLGLALEGATLVRRARLREGMRRLDEATAMALAREATIPISGAWACCFLVSACAAAGDWGRAAEWCDRIAELAERYGSRYMLAFCRAEYGAVHLWRGRWAQAEALLEAAAEDFARSRPALAGAPLATLAELRRRQGRRDEAERLLEGAGASDAALVCRARIALDGGAPRHAAEIAERVRRRRGDRALDAAPALEALARARAAAGDAEGAAEAAAALGELAARVPTAPLRASADLAAGLVAAARGDHEGARWLLEDAADRLEGAGAPFDAALARLELALSLAGAGHDDAARAEAARAAARLEELGAAEAARARRLSAPQAPVRVAGPVTAREREVLALLAEGLTNRQIAARLVLSEHTVRRHVANILRKLGLRSRTAAAAHAVRAGLAPPRGG